MKIKHVILPACLVLLLTARGGHGSGLLLPRQPYYGDNPPYIESDSGMIWLEPGGGWDLYLRICFNGDRQPFLWLVPLPGLPIVPESRVNEYIFNDIENLTAPTFLEQVCYHPSCHDHPACEPQGAGEEVVVEPDMEVGGKLSLWQPGRMEFASYSIVAPPYGQDIIEWIQERQYAISPEAGTILGQLQSEGTFFFAGEVDPLRPENRDIMCVAPLLLKFQEETPLVYPLRLTAASSAPEMELAIWLVSRLRDAWLPSNYDWTFITAGGAEGDEISFESYEQQASEVFGGSGTPPFIVQYADELKERDDRFHGYSLASVSGLGYLTSMQALSTQEIRDLYAAGVSSDMVVRLTMQLGPGDISGDVTFEIRELALLPDVKNLLWRACKGNEVVSELCASCAMSARTPREEKPCSRGPCFAVFLLVASLIGLLVFLGRRRR